MEPRAVQADRIIDTLDPDRPVLIAGPTASGKSALALAIAQRTGRAVVNADALQVHADWRVLTARPTPDDERAAAHRLYGHVEGACAYSAGDWLRAVAPLLPGRPVIVGGTGLNFAALTQGLAEIPPTPPAIRACADRRIAAEGARALLSELDAASRDRIDPANPARIQRAWEVLRTTGRGIADWQDATPPPLLPLAHAQPLLLCVDRDTLALRIAARVDAMLAGGALDEARANRDGWSPARPSAKAIGAAELMAHLDGRMPLDAVRARMIVLTRQYAKRQRTWFRARMGDWIAVAADHTRD